MSSLQVAIPGTDFGAKIALIINVLVIRITLRMILPLGVGVVQGLRHGFLTQDHIYLVAGAVLTPIFAFFYAQVGIKRAYGWPKRFWMRAATACEIIPVFFTAYLMLYRGAWGGVRLFWDFSFSGLVTAAAFAYFGMVAAEACQKLIGLTVPIETVASRFDDIE